MENLSNPNNCPIALYQKAINLRPRPVEGKPFKCSNKLFLQALKTRRAEQWFGGQPHSKKTIGTWMTMLCEEACIEPRTNHCGRRSFCTRLVSIVEDLQQVTQFTGHKNVNSLKAYTAFAGERLRSVHEQLRGDEPLTKRQRVEVEITRTTPDGTEEHVSLSQSSSEEEPIDPSKGMSFLNDCDFGSNCRVVVNIHPAKKKKQLNNTKFTFFGTFLSLKLLASQALYGRKLLKKVNLKLETSQQA